MDGQLIKRCEWRSIQADNHPRVRNRVVVVDIEMSVSADVALGV